MPEAKAEAVETTKREGHRIGREEEGDRETFEEDHRSEVVGTPEDGADPENHDPENHDIWKSPCTKGQTRFSVTDVKSKEGTMLKSAK